MHSYFTCPCLKRIHCLPMKIKDFLEVKTGFNLDKFVQRLFVVYCFLHFPECFGFWRYVLLDKPFGFRQRQCISFKRQTAVDKPYLIINAYVLWMFFKFSKLSVYLNIKFFFI